MPNIFVQCLVEPVLLPRLQYVLDFLTRHPLAPEGVRFTLHKEDSEQTITYGDKAIQGEGSHMPAQEYFFRASLPNRTTVFLKPFAHQGVQIYAVQIGETSEQLEPLFFEHGRFGFDIFETIFYHISRWEEWNCFPNELDQHGRMNPETMTLVKNDLHLVPVVDQLVWCFFQALGLPVLDRRTTRQWSHDVDLLRKFPNTWKFAKAVASMLFFQKSGRGFRTLFKQFWKTKWQRLRDPFDTFDWLLREGGGGEKVIYWLSGGQRKGIENHFDISDPEVKSLMESARSRGYQIGLHPSYDAALNERLFLSELMVLTRIAGQPILHSRQHFLRWQFPETPVIIEKSGIRFDSTLGFSDRIGFRCGTGFPYRLYHFKEERAFEFFEIPLVVMDVALLRQSGFDFLKPAGNEQALQKAAASLLSFLDQNEKLTDINFNIHNSTFDEVYLDVRAFRQLWEKVFDRFSV